MKDNSEMQRGKAEDKEGRTLHQGHQPHTLPHRPVVYTAQLGSRYWSF